MIMEALLLTYSLSGAAGIRSSLAMLAVSIGVHSGYLHPDPSMAWVGSWWLITLSLAGSLVEFCGDKVPVLDHGLHVIHLALAPLVGGIIGMTGHQGDPALDVMLGILGGGNALLLHSARAGLRGVLSFATVGMANPVISIVEDVVAAAIILIAILAPVATALALLLATIWLVKRVKRMVVA
jgi:hypothetical protein